MSFQPRGIPVRQYDQLTLLRIWMDRHEGMQILNLYVVLDGTVLLVWTQLL